METKKTTIRLPPDVFEWLSNFPTRSGKIVLLVREAIAKETLEKQKQEEIAKQKAEERQKIIDGGGIPPEIWLNYLHKPFRGRSE